MTRRGRKGMVVWKQWKSEKPWVPKQSTFWVYAVQNIHFNYFLLLFYASPAYIPLASKRVETDPEKPPGLCSSNLSPLTHGKTKAWAEKSFEGYLVSNRAVYIWLRGLTSLVHRDLQNLVDFLPGPALCDWVVACIILCVCVCVWPEEDTKSQACFDPSRDHEFRHDSRACKTRGYNSWAVQLPTHQLPWVAHANPEDSAGVCLCLPC